MAFCLSFISCSTSDSPADLVLPVVEVEDSYRYIVLRHDGQLFEVGDNSSVIKKINKIPDVDMISVGNAITWSPDKVYFYEHKFPSQQPLIYVYNLSTKKTNSHIIEFPESAFGPFAGMVALEWDASKKSLLAFIIENFGENRLVPSKLAQIDPETFLVSPLDIEVSQSNVMGSLIKDNLVYASSYRSHSSGYESDFSG